MSDPGVDLLGHQLEASHDLEPDEIVAAVARAGQAVDAEDVAVAGSLGADERLKAECRASGTATGNGQDRSRTADLRRAGRDPLNSSRTVLLT
jgi:hypothetical protein